MTAPSIQLANITVRFGAVTALEDISLALPPGERIAVIGENGAGKSTLMRVLFGLLQPDSGELRLEGSATRFSSPRAAINAGIGMVQQHFELIAPFTVTENIILGSEPCHGMQINLPEAHAQIQRLAEESGLAVDPRARVEELSVAAQQRVEILKALYRKARVLILDEPTATLAPPETRDLWAATRRLTALGVTVVFITHKLSEVMAHADSVTVLRRGKHILTAKTSETTTQELAVAMVGSSREEGQRSGERASEGAGLTLHNLTVRNDRGVVALENLTLSVAPGEIMGVAGVDGSGQTELIEVIVGLRQPESGTIERGGKEAAIGFIPEDRHRHGVVQSFSLAENIVLGRHRETSFRGVGGVMKKNALREFLAECVATFDVRGAEQPSAPMHSLSGGNQQKLVLARELSKNPRVIVASQPTRGLDFAATAFVHERLREAADNGAAVLVQSLDLSEVLTLSDRVAVLLEGKLVGVVDRAEATEERIGALMTGAHGVEL
ncbi:ABC transporter ATP-binding protein [Armatimonas sp.]|uniref:ABC transporter ATP-binding protein n=1 Tax=Armatimonas sp. TaxID=1872638 RepID=UPI00375268E2